MRGRGWTEAEVAKRILPYMPRGAGAGARANAPTESLLPGAVSIAWLDRQLPAMDRAQIQLVVEELERRGWPATEVAIAVLPHLLPKLPPADAKAVLAGLGELGLAGEDIARLARPR